MIDLYDTVHKNYQLVSRAETKDHVNLDMCVQMLEIKILDMCVDVLQFKPS